MTWGRGALSLVSKGKMEVFIDFAFCNNCIMVKIIKDRNKNSDKSFGNLIRWLIWKQWLIKSLFWNSLFVGVCFKGDLCSISTKVKIWNAKLELSLYVLWWWGMILEILSNLFPWFIPILDLYLYLIYTYLIFYFLTLHNLSSLKGSYFVNLFEVSHIQYHLLPQSFLIFVDIFNKISTCRLLNVYLTFIDLMRCDIATFSENLTEFPKL